MIGWLVGVLDLIHWRHPAEWKRTLFVCVAHSINQWTASFWSLREGALLKRPHVHKVYCNLTFSVEFKIVILNCLWEPSQIIKRAELDTSRRQQRRLPPWPLVIALLPLKCSSRNLQFPHRLHLIKEKIALVHLPFQKRSIQACILLCFYVDVLFIKQDRIPVSFRDTS